MDGGTCSGDPLLLENFWKQNPDMGTVVVPGWYRMSYLPRDGATSFYTDGLIAAIRALHAKVGNAVTEGRYILLGTGSMQLINAAVASLALDNTTISSHVVAKLPYYGVNNCDLYNSWWIPLIVKYSKYCAILFLC